MQSFMDKAEKPLYTEWNSYNYTNYPVSLDIAPLTRA